MWHNTLSPQSTLQGVYPKSYFVLKKKRCKAQQRWLKPCVWTLGRVTSVKPAADWTLDRWVLSTFVRKPLLSSAPSSSVWFGPDTGMLRLPRQAAAVTPRRDNPCCIRCWTVRLHRTRAIFDLFYLFPKAFTQKARRSRAGEQQLLLL